MGTTKTRQAKIEWMQETITQFFKSKPKGEIDKNKLLAEFAIKNNSTIRTGEEILKLLEFSKFIKIDKNIITKQ